MPYAQEIPRRLPSRPAAILVALACALLLQWSCGDGQERSAALPAGGGAGAPDAAAAQKDVEEVGGALRELREARTAAEIQERYPMVRMAADALAESLIAVSAQFEATVAAGQQVLSTRAQAAPQAGRPPANGDLAMAVDSLLMCRIAYAQVSDAYREKLLQLTRALEADQSVSGVQAAAPTIAGLLEDQSQLRSILTDVSAKSKAVLAEIAIVQVAR
jgi:hypothetical protein